ncbi:fam-j protein [Plasmodium relictum]|uniref:Fam-j protein n=1 Tax=Plasmodium relictum TaxID=85471 RepID=A0A1J1GJV3_PLARL|nr:fam-j protein [Plasmodium relictum]CRG84042.1 fam-j protein [Plasmodium relictum]
MLHIKFFFYSLQYAILINICISQEQHENLDLSSEEIYSNNYIRDKSHSIRNLIYTKDIEQDEIPDIPNISIDFSMEQQHSTTHKKKELHNMESLDGTTYLEKSKSHCLENSSDGVQNELPILTIEPIDFFCEPNYSSIITETEHSNISSIDTKNKEHENSHNLQYIFNYEPVTPNYRKGGLLELLLGDQYSTINYENILFTANNLIPTENANEESVESQMINDELSTEQQNLTTYMMEESSRSVNLMDIENEKCVGLENALPGSSKNQPTASIKNSKENSRLIKKYKRKSNKILENESNEEEINEIHKKILHYIQNCFIDLSARGMGVNDGNAQSCIRYLVNTKCHKSYDSDDNSNSNYLHVSSRGKDSPNRDIENLVYSLSTFFEREIYYLSNNTIPNLEKIKDSLRNEIVNKYSNLEKKLNINVFSLKALINEELLKINPYDFTKIKEYYDRNIRDTKSEESYNYILSFKHSVNYKFNKKEEIFQRMRELFEFFRELIPELEFMKQIDDVKSTIMDNFMHNKLFQPRFIQSCANFKRLFDLLESMDKYIGCVEESLKNGFLLRECTYKITTQHFIQPYSIRKAKSVQERFIKLQNIFDKLNLSYEDYNIIINSIFYFFNKENAKNRKELDNLLSKNNYISSMKMIQELLLEEEKCILEYHEEACKVFNLNLNEENKKGKNFNDFINDTKKVRHLSYANEILMELLGEAFIIKQVNIINKIRKLLIFINENSKKKNISHETKEILTKKHQLHLLSIIEAEKSKLEKIKLKIINLYLFSTLKSYIKTNISKKLYKKIMKIKSILERPYFMIYNKINEDNTKENIDNMQCILLALFHINQRLTDFTKNETE